MTETHTMTPNTNTPKHRRTIAATATAILLTTPIIPTAADAHLDPPGRKAPTGCTAITVQPGDTVWAIAKANTLTLDQIATLNPHITNLNLIRPGDQIAVTCKPNSVALAIPQTVTRTATTTTAPATTTTLPGIEKWADEHEPDGRLTWHAIIANLYIHGDMRGENLITLAAIAECESNRWPNAIGDNHLTNSKWGPSYGIWQVRSINDAARTGAPRDPDALQTSVAHQAWAASEVWRSQGFKAWTCYVNGHHRGLIETVRQAAAEIGAI